VLLSTNDGKPSASIAETDGRPIENLDRGSIPKTNPKVAYWVARPGGSPAAPDLWDIFGEK
jgi:hypothetical protein